MASAKVVVASHGAGLTNLVWCSPGANVAEFFAAEYINGCYWNIANMLDLKYSFAIGDRTLSDVEDGPAIMNMRRLESDLIFPEPDRLFERIMAFVSNGEL